MDNPRNTPNLDRDDLRNDRYDRRDDFHDSVHTRRANPTEVAYRDGYMHGRERTRRVPHRVAPLTERDTAENSLLAGVLLAATVALLGGLFYFVSAEKRLNSTPTVAPAPSTVPNATQPQENQDSQSRTTIIERNTERVQEPAPATGTTQIIVPAPQSSGATAPNGQTQPTQAPSSPNSQSQTAPGSQNQVAPATQDQSNQGQSSQGQSSQNQSSQGQSGSSTSSGTGQAQ